MKFLPAEMLDLKNPKVGIYEGVTQDDYDAAGGVRRSSLTNMMRSPKYYNYMKNNPFKATDAMQFGIAFHCAILEPDTWEDQVAVGPDVGKNTKLWKAFKAEQQDGKRVILHPDDMVIMDKMLESYRNHDLAMSFIKGNKIEQSAWGVIDGYLCKARNDTSNYNRMIIGDVKTSQEADFDNFQRSAYKYKYHVQAAYYLDVFNSAMRNEDPECKLFEKFLFIVIEKNPPYDIQVYVADPGFIDEGRRIYRECLATLSDCEKTNVWPGYDKKVLNLSLPRWA